VNKNSEKMQFFVINVERMDIIGTQDFREKIMDTGFIIVICIAMVCAIKIYVDLSGGSDI